MFCWEISELWVNIYHCRLGFVFSNQITPCCVASQKGPNVFQDLVLPMDILGFPSVRGVPKWLVNNALGIQSHCDMRDCDYPIRRFSWILWDEQSHLKMDGNWGVPLF